MSRIINIAIHHSGGTAGDPYWSSQKMTLDQLNKAHEQRWPDFKSQLGSFVGYNSVGLPDGSYQQFRKIGEETAAQVGFDPIAKSRYNLTTYSHMLMGNFTRKLDGSLVDNPTHAQISTMVKIIVALLENDPYRMKLTVVPSTKIEIILPRIQPHRYYQPTQCFGTGLHDGWAQMHTRILLLNRQLTLYERIYQLYMLWLKLKSGNHSGAMPSTASCFELELRG